MTRLFPKSLIGQLLLLVALILLVAQGINMFLLYRGMNQQNLVEASASAVTRMAVGLNRLDNIEERPRREGRRGRHIPRGRLGFSDQPAVSDGMRRMQSLEERAQQALYSMGVDARDIRAARSKTLPADLSENVIGMPRFRPRVDAVGRSLGERRSRRQIDGFIILSSKLPDGRWVNLASVVRSNPDFLIRTLIFQTVVLYLLMLIPLILLGRYISRPLKILTHKAQTFGFGDKDLLEETGPPDTKKLIAAFNEMQVRVNSMLNEKDVMLGAIGHDLRTPLAALRVRMESVEDKDERLRMIAGIEEMDGMLDDILSLARLGKSQEQAEPNDIGALIGTVVDEFVDMERDVQFESPDRTSIAVRATLIRRALRNLIGNAVKYGGSAHVSVDKSADRLLIHVDDNGPGLPEDQIEALFEPFARAEKSRNRKTGGSGLGLTLARAIAREHGGDVVLQNRDEGGLRASLYLPA